MSYRLVIFVAAVFASQVNAQLSGGGFIRPFITGYANGFSEFAKPFIQLGQSMMTPTGEYFSSNRPQAPQWMPFPNQPRPIVPTPTQVQNAPYEGYDAVASGFPQGANIVQFVRPRPYHPFMYQVPNQGNNLVRPPLAYPVPSSIPASETDSSSSSSSEESDETYTPTNLLPQPFQSSAANAAETAGRIPQTVGSNVASNLEKPLETVENAISN